MNQGEIVIYNSINDPHFQIDVRVENETVCLNRQQIAILFDRDIKTIDKHINNVLKEELSSYSVTANFVTTAADLDMIISFCYPNLSKANQNKSQFKL